MLPQQPIAMLPLQESGAKLTSQLAALTALVRSPLEEDARRKGAALVSRDLSTFVAKSSLHVSEQTLHAMLWKRGVSPLITRRQSARFLLLVALHQQYLMP